MSGYNDGTVRVINVSLGTSQQLAQVGANAYRLALAGTAQRLYVSSTDGNVYVVSTATMAAVDTIPLGGALQGMALNSTGSELYVSSTDGTVFRVERRHRCGAGFPRGGRFSRRTSRSRSDGAKVYVANQTGWVDVLDAGTLASQGRYPAAGAFGLRPTVDGTQLYVTSPTLGT